MELKVQLETSLILAAGLAAVLSVVLGYVAGHYFTSHFIGLNKSKKSILKDKDGKARRLKHLASTLTVVAICFGIALVVAKYAVSIWGETLGLAATIGISVGIILSYLADARKL